MVLKKIVIGEVYKAKLIPSDLMFRQLLVARKSDEAPYDGAESPTSYLKYGNFEVAYFDVATNLVGGIKRVVAGFVMSGERTDAQSLPVIDVLPIPNHWDRENLEKILKGTDKMEIEFW